LFLASSSTSSLSEMPHECKPPLSYANCAGLTGSSSSKLSSGDVSQNTSLVIFVFVLRTKSEKFYFKNKNKNVE